MSGKSHAICGTRRDVFMFGLQLNPNGAESMSSESLTLLSDDDETHNALERAFAKLPPVALVSFLRVRKVSERNSAIHFAESQRNATLVAKMQDWKNHVSTVDRDLARGQPVHKVEMEKYEANKRKISKAVAEMTARRNKKQTPNLNDEFLAEFVLDNARKPFKPATADVKLAKGQSPAAALDETRVDLASAFSRLTATKNELILFDEALARLIADVDAKAAGPNFKPVTQMQEQYFDYVSATGARRPKIQGRTEWPTKHEILEGGNPHEFDRGTAMLCWLHRDAIIARGKAELTKLYAGRKGISEADRTHQLAAIEDEILTIERREELLVRLCEDANLTVYRRPTANPQAVLQITPA